jgi:transcriptional regulator with GAF, ATPase, and Fis domain
VITLAENLFWLNNSQADSNRAMICWRETCIERTTIPRILCAASRSPRESAPDPGVDGALLGGCPAMREVYKAIGHVASRDVTVLIISEI